MQQNPTVGAGPELKYAGFWIRVWATLVDSFLLSIVVYPFLCSYYGQEYMDPDRIVAGPMDFFTTWVFPAVAVIFFWMYYQATPGKMLVSAKLVDARGGGQPSLAQCVGRYLAYIPSTLFFGLGLIWVAFDARKQGWHDKLAGTLVVRKQGDRSTVPEDWTGN